MRTHDDANAITSPAATYHMVNKLYTNQGSAAALDKPAHAPLPVSQRHHPLIDRPATGSLVGKHSQQSQLSLRIQNTVNVLKVLHHFEA